MRADGCGLQRMVTLDPLCARSSHEGTCADCLEPDIATQVVADRDGWKAGRPDPIARPARPDIRIRLVHRLRHWTVLIFANRINVP